MSPGAGPAGPGDGRPAVQPPGQPTFVVP